MWRYRLASTWQTAPPGCFEDLVRRGCQQALWPQHLRSISYGSRGCRSAVAMILGQGVMANFRLAEQLFLISHDHLSGRASVGVELIECGLVGALFGELIIEGRLSIKDGFVVVLESEPINDGLADRLVDTIDRQSTNHRVWTWAAELGPDAYRIVAERLVVSGTLRRERGRRLFGYAGDRYPAVDLYDAARPRLMLNHVIRNRDEMELDLAVLAALLAALGVEPILGPDISQETERLVLSSLVYAMPSPLQELLAGIDEIVASISSTMPS